MKANIAVLLVSVSLWAACWGQDIPKRSVPPECGKTIRTYGSFPKRPFHFLPKESYKGSPLIKFQIQEDGAVSGAIVLRSSGVADIDQKVLDAIERWQYQPRPSGCGPIEVKMSVTVDWADSR